MKQIAEDSQVVQLAELSRTPGDARIVQPLHPLYLRCRDVAERLIALGLLILMLPLLVMMGLLVRAGSPGGAIYFQKRLGQGGREYWMLKIRTMRQDSETDTGPVWAAKQDGRVTPLGQFFRETHLDELPQLWNVVRGEMSLIGPRPERREIANWIEQTAPHYRERLRVRPGLTGLAQVELPADRDITDACRKLAFDLYYVREVSPLLDIRIMLSTILHLLGLMADSLGRRLVRSCRQAVEQRAPSAMPMEEAQNDEVSAL